MPCVLPVLGLKINSFMQDLQSNKINIKLSSLSIVLGIISTFLLFAFVTSILSSFGKSVGGDEIKVLLLFYLLYSY